MQRAVDTVPWSGASIAWAVISLGAMQPHSLNLTQLCCWSRPGFLAEGGMIHHLHSDCQHEQLTSTVTSHSATTDKHPLPLSLTCCHSPDEHPTKITHQEPSKNISHKDMCMKTWLVAWGNNKLCLPMVSFYSRVRNLEDIKSLQVDSVWVSWVDPVTRTRNSGCLVFLHGQHIQTNRFPALEISWKTYQDYMISAERSDSKNITLTGQNVMKTTVYNNNI